MTFVIPPSDEWWGFGDLSCVGLCLPLLVFASRCKAGTYQRYAFESHDQPSFGHQAHQHVAQFVALRSDFAGKACCHVALACCISLDFCPCKRGAWSGFPDWKSHRDDQAICSREYLGAVRTCLRRCRQLCLLKCRLARGPQPVRRAHWCTQLDGFLES